MNLVGKIFVVLIFVMSVVFMAFAIAVYSSHRNWRQEVMKVPGGYKDELENSRKETKSVGEDRDRIQRKADADNAANSQAMAKLQADFAPSSSQLATLKQQYDQQGQKLVAATDGLKIAQQNVTDMGKEVATLRTEIRTVHGDAAEQFSKATALADTLHEVAGQLSLSNERNQQLTTAVSIYREKIKRNNLPDTLSLDDKPPRVTGLVLGVGKGSIEISLGSDDGLQREHELDVYRGNKYLGRVRVAEVHPDRAVANILPDFRQGTIKRGDNVAAK